MENTEIKQMLVLKRAALDKLSLELKRLESLGLDGFSKAIDNEIKDDALRAGMPIDTVDLYKSEIDRLYREIQQTNSYIDKLKNELK